MASTANWCVHGGIFLRNLRFTRRFGDRNITVLNNKRTKIRAQTVSPNRRINVDYLEREFSGHGASFRGIGDGCVVAMRLEGGGSSSIILPGGLISSYKPRMWHGSSVEVLHTSVTEDNGGGIAINGGIFVDLVFERDGGSSRWSPRVWDLRNVSGSPDSSIQVELVSCDPDGSAEIKHLVTFRQDVLASEIEITNLSDSPLVLGGSVISHLKVSTPDATYAVGLEGSNYSSRESIGSSNFSITPPESSQKNSENAKSFIDLFSRREKEPEDDDDGEEKDNYAQLSEKMSRIYTTAPRVFTIIDRGRRNSVVVERRGFEELYLYSPGSEHESYGKYSYISTGPSAILKPVIVSPRGVWRGGQYLHNPNT